MPSTLSPTQQQSAAEIVAAWLGPQMRMDEKPVPISREASNSGTGIRLDPEWDWPAMGPAPTLLLEGGPEDWALRAGGSLRDELRAIGVHAEAYSTYALCLYPV